MPQVTRRDEESPGGTPCPKCGSARELITGETRPGESTTETWMCRNGHIEVRLANRPTAGGEPER